MLPRFTVQSDVTISVTHFTPTANPDLPVIVLCHPTGFCAAIYASVVAHLRNVNIFGIDMRNHGYSDRGDVSQWAGFGIDLENACTAIKKRTGKEKIVGIGISSGASAHILNASKNKNLYEGLYLCEPILFPPGLDLSNRSSLASSAKNRRNFFESRDEVFNRYSEKGPLSKLNPSSLALYCTHGFTEIDNKINNGVTLRCKKEDEEQIYLSGSVNNVYEALDEVQCKTIVAHGELSTTVSREHAELIGQKLNSNRVVTLPDVGHFTFLENPVLGAKEITSFVEAL